jgi:transcriptional regulator with XRE-family HTH domain
MPKIKNAECVQLGNRIRALRHKKGFSQEGFADRADLHRTYLGGLERGERNPTLTVLVRVAKALSVPVSKLVDGVGNG